MTALKHPIISRYCFIIIVLIFYLPGSAQNLAGKVYDSASGQALPFVTIHVLDNRDRPLKTTVSDSLGRFTLSLDTGHYLFVYTCVGYNPYQRREIITDPLVSTTLAPVFLSRGAKQLSEVTVVGRKPVIEPSADGFVYNPENDVPLAGGSAVDVLRRIPMVSVTPDGSPSIRGSTNIRVFIDQKPSTVYAATVADALQQLAPEDIARIEVITNPSSKYDAEGTDAVINIITKRNRYNGLNGQLRATLGNWQQDLTSSLKMRSGDWIANMETGLYFSRNENGYTLTRLPQPDVTPNRLLQQREGTSKQNVQLVSLNIIRIVDSLHSINAGYRFRNFASREEAVQYTQLFAQDTVSSDFYRDLPGRYTNDVHTITAGYSGQSRNKQKELNIQGAWFGHTGTDEYNLRQFRGDVIDHRETSDGNTSNKEFTVQADFTRHFGPLSKFETGVKGNWRNSRAINLVDVYNESQQAYLRDNVRSNSFDYNRGIYAAYANYSLAIKDWQLKAGMRFELTRLYTQFKDTALQIPDFNNLLPNLLVKKKLTEKSSLSYAYNPRINRPFLHFLNPNINYVDSLNIQYGNPGLVPEVVHNHNLEFTSNNRSFFSGVSLIYTRRSRGIEEIRLPRTDKIVESTYRNIGVSETVGLSASTRYSSASLTIGSTIVVRRLWLSSPALGITNRGWVTTMDLNTSYRFKKGYSIESFVYVESGSVALQQERSWYLFYNLLVSKKMMDDKLNITFRADGFLHPWFYRTTTIDVTSFYQATRYRSINRYLRLVVSYKFGKKDIRMPAQNTITSE